jgi:hypothetical protein
VALSVCSVRIRANSVALLLCAAPVLAQQGSVAGTVFDSVAMRPLANASVQIVARNAPDGALHSAVTDANGRYELHLQPGSYLAAFEASALDSLGIKVEPVAFEVRAGERAAADMAVPTPKRIVAALCGRADEEIGAVVGFVRDAHTGNPVDSGKVEAVWHELIIRKGGLRYEEVGAEVRVRQDGWFALCGVAPEGEAFITATRRSDHTSEVLLRVPAHGLVRRDLFIGGTTVVRGRVMTDDGPARGAEIRVSGRARPAITDSVGRFVVTQTPAGTQTVEARLLGYFPDRRVVELSADAENTLDFRLTKFKKVMDTIQVVAERVYASRLADFRDRKKRGGAGTFLDERYIEASREKDLYGLLKRVPSIRISDWRGGKRVTMRDGQRDCVPALYLDRARVESGVLNDLGKMLPVVEIGGIEVYRGANAPAEFPSFTGCGVVVIWTRPVPRK